MARRVRKTEEKLRLIRYASMGFVALFVVVVAVVGIIYGTAVDVGGEATEDSHYRVVEGAGESRARTVEVVEFFSYGCVHCRDFDPMLEAWEDTLPEGASFRRAHVGFAGGAEVLARAHVVLGRSGALDANHERLFRAMHDRNREFTDRGRLADFVDGYGIEREVFLAAIDEPSVRRRVAEIDQTFRDAGLLAVPALVVADKYVVNMDIGRKPALDVVDQLVARELEARRTQEQASDDDGSG